MSEDMNRVAASLPPSPQEFTFSNITNASIKIPFKHHAYFSITIVHRSPLVPSTSALSPLHSLCLSEEGGVKGHRGQMMLLCEEKLNEGEMKRQRQT